MEKNMDSTKWHEPFLVVGPGRSGTSSVARVLHEKLGIHMGSNLRKPNDRNPKGFYEDVQFCVMNQRLLDAWFSQLKVKKPWLRWTGGLQIAHEGCYGSKSWQKSYQLLMENRRASKRPWGIKDPCIAHVWPLMKDVKFTRIIRCRRSKQAIVASIQRCYGWSRAQAEAFCELREKSLDQLPKPMAEIDIDQNPTDQDIESMLSIHTTL
jgi:hypothetical protein